MVLTARQGGVEVRDALAEIDQAVDSQIELEVLVHGFATGEGTEFDAIHAEGLEHVLPFGAQARKVLPRIAAPGEGLGEVARHKGPHHRHCEILKFLAPHAAAPMPVSTLAG